MKHVTTEEHSLFRGFIIRNAKDDDIDSLTGLLKILFSIETDFVYNEHLQRRGLKAMLDNRNGCVLVAEAEGRVIGMCSGQLTASTAEGKPSLLVEDVVVKKKWRGQGIAKQMLDSLAQWASAQGAERMQLLADRNNAPAINFYKKIGWQQTQLVCLRKRNPSM